MIDPPRIADREGLSGRLLRSARSDSPSERARQRAAAAVALAASMVATRTAASVAGVAHGALVKWLLGALAGIVLAAQIVASNDSVRAPPPPSAPITVSPAPSATPASALPSATPASALPSASAARPISPAPSAIALPPPVPPRPPPVVPSLAASAASSEPPPAASATLGDEIALLDEAKRALGAGRPAGALSLLDRYTRTFPRGRLAQEAMAIRIEALVAAGDRPSATALLDRFAAAYPTSPALDRLRSLLQR